MTTELVKINPSDFGLTESTAQNIQEQFKPMLDKMVELENEFNEVVKLEIGTIEAEQKARELRLKYVKVRTGTAEIHKQQKAFYLNGGRFVDGWKNAQLFASQGKEEKLEQIEKYRQIQEAKRKEELRLKRIELLQPFCDNVDLFPLADMNDEVFEQLLEGQKLAHSAKIEAERKAEEERIAAIEAEKKRIEEQRLENERLKKEAEKLAEEKRKADEAAAEAIAELRRKEAEELAEQKRIEAERKAAELAAKKAAAAPDKDKLKSWVNSFTLQSIELKTEQSIDVANEIKSKFESFKNWAKTQIDNFDLT